MLSTTQFGQQPLQFEATLSGAMEVPPVLSPGVGMSVLSFDPTLSSLRVGLVVSNLRQVREAHIHLGRPGENGPIVLFLYGPALPVDITAPTVLTSGTFTATNLTGPLTGMPMSVLAQQMLSGNTYVNVHTVTNPGGEIRGQVTFR
ncbi:MAG TPA: CHRD domain-containing protein [Symbiobacteriaceae bacterium]|nr:CHRD domain-containing protein [Symbiobacteriaceae bacterium]